jgi:putative ABC transport system permease protein
MPPWLIRVRTIFRRTRMERELDAELAFHLEMQAAEFVRRGMSPEQARIEARQAFGGVEHVKEDVRDTWLARMTEAAVQDIRYGARSLGRNRGYAAAVIITMALGIGANSAIFSVVNAVVLRPLPYGRGADIVLLRQPRSDVETTGFSLQDIDRLKAATTALDAVVEYHNMYFILLGGEEPARVATGVVSWDYFETLGIAPVAGRTFTAADDGPGATPTLILSYEYWQRAFDGDPGVVGKVLQMNDHPHTVIGVLPDVPMYPVPNDVYMPRSACPFRMSASQLNRRGSGMAAAFGRRRPGVTMDQVADDLDRVGRAWQASDPASYPAGRGHRLSAEPLRREFSRNFESTLVVLLCTAGFVLLIVCASVTNLAVARTMRRERELALRSALGATRARIFRQVMTESVILSAAGGIAGVFVAIVAADLLTSYAARFTARASEIRVDRTVLAFTLALSLLTGFLGSLLPALSRRRASGPNNGRMTARHADIRRALIVAQVAASFMLLVGAGLTIRSLMKLTGVDPGFRSAEVLTLQLDMNFTKYGTAPEQAAFLERIEARLRRVPGVSMAGAAGTLPFLERSVGAPGRFRVEGEPGTPAPTGRASFLLASEDYFRAIDVPLLAGRFFNAGDRLDTERVVIVNETLARRHWHGESAVGKHIGYSDDGWYTIVGVVGSVRQQLSLQPVDEVYLPMRQVPYVSTNWVLRSTVDLQTLAPAVREAVYDVDVDQPIHRLQALDDIRFASLAPPRLTATLLGMFAALALLITAAGIAGVIAFSVSQRTQEFGVRVALGARRADVASMVVGEGVRLAVKGLVLGAVGALLLGGLLSTLLFGIGPTDSVTYLSVSSVLLIVAALACLVPALRAAAVDPMQALRTT